jgi:hypothetical protein
MMVSRRISSARCSGPLGWCAALVFGLLFSNLPFGGLGLSGATWAQGAGHRVTGDQVIVEGQRHWQNWTFPSGTLVISPDGEVQTQRVSRSTNAVFDIVDYLRFNPPSAIDSKETADIVLADGIKGGSNIGDVVNVLDGDLSTYWQPDEPVGDSDLASQWWFTIDLGRLVFADELVLRFVEEGQGDPFLLFEVLISDGQKPARLQGGDTPDFKTVLRTPSENKSQREFRVDLSNREPTVEAAPLRFVQVLVTATDGLLGAEVTQAEYEALEPGRQGAVQHFKLQPDGREVPVDEALYDVLESVRQGSVRYFRREEPRLAELEVWNEGDELGAGILARSGSISTSAKQPLAFRKFIDGDLETSNRIFYGTASAVADPDLELVYDFGSFFWVDSYRMALQNFFPDYRIDLSDGTRAPDGSLEWVNKASLGPRPSTFFEGADFEPIKARFARIQWTLTSSGARTTDVAELQFYGEGFQPEVSMKSDLIRLGGSRNLLSIEWDADTPPGTEIQIQTRTGNELGEILHYFKNDGTEVSETDYNRLLSLFKGDIVAEQVPGSDWSNFSEPYTVEAGTPVTSPSPREFLEVKATLVSDDPDLSPTLRSVRLNFSDPVAQNLQGEISPFQVEELGVKRRFSLYIRPLFSPRDPGFDQLLLVAPTNMELELAGIYGGRAADFDGEEADVTGLALEGVELVPTANDSLHVRFGRIEPNSGTDIVRLDFETSLFVTGAVLQASLRNGAEAGGGTWQRVDPGDALRTVLSNTTTVVSGVGNKSLFTEVEVPEAFSPNGDGTNDQALFTFKVVRVGDASPVEAVIYDMGGRPVRRIDQQRQVSAGLYQMAWDGRDDADRMVPPGIYVVHLSVDTDIEGANIRNAEVIRAVAVAY